eukprot:4635818-Amphidinium_carterae.4
MHNHEQTDLGEPQTVALQGSAEPRSTGLHVVRDNLAIRFTAEHKIHLTPDYLYLGKFTNTRLNEQREVSVRCAKTIAAFNLHKKVLTSTRFSTKRRIQLLHTLCLVHLFQEHHTTIALTHRQYQQLNKVYISVLKRTCRLHVSLPTSWHLISDKTFLEVTEQPELALTLRSKRLQFLQRLCLTDNDFVRASLGQCCANSFWDQWFRDLAEVQQVSPTLQHLPHPEFCSMSVWITHLVLAGDTWSAHLCRLLLPTAPVPALEGHTLMPHFFTDTYLTLNDTLTEGRELPHMDVDVPPHPPGIEFGDPHAPHLPPADGEPEDELPFKCDLCDRAFKQYNGLSTHKRRTHRVFPPLALRIRGTTCVVCHSQLSTRRHLIEHLNNRLECALPTLHLLQPMTEEEYARRIADLQAEDASLTRDIAPRTGPIRTVHNVPVSEGVAIVNPFAQADEDPALAI